MEVAPRLLKLLETECFTICVVLPRARRPAQRDKIDDPMVLLEGHLYGHPLAGLLWERKLEELLLQEIREKCQKLGMFMTSIERQTILVRR